VPNGVIESFDRESLIGVVRVADVELRFHSTSFQAASSFRWPRVGEVVEVVTNRSGDLVAVHGA